MDRSAAGTPIPDIIVVDPSGEELGLATLEGTPVLLNLWATWCAPCIVEMPLLDGIAAEYEGELRVVTVSQDLQGAQAVEPFFAKHGYANLEPWLDPANTLAFEFGLDSGLPITILYDATGREIWRYHGDREWTSAEARSDVEEAL